MTGENPQIEAVVHAGSPVCGVGEVRRAIAYLRPGLASVWEGAAHIESKVEASRRYSLDGRRSISTKFCRTKKGWEQCADHWFIHLMENETS